VHIGEEEEEEDKQLSVQCAFQPIFL
jgi:hypothetical protein